MAPQSHFDERYFEGCGSNYVFGYGPLRHRVFWLGRLEVLRQNLKGGNVLDVGCAYGYFLSHLPKEYAGFGVDISPHAIRNARELVPGGRVAVADVSSGIPFDVEFDAVTCFDVLEHVSDLQGAVRNIAGHLRRGGVLILELPVAPLVYDRDGSHIYRSSKEYEDTLSKEGFAVKNVRRSYSLGSRIAMFPAIFGHNYVRMVAYKS